MSAEVVDLMAALKASLAASAEEKAKKAGVEIRNESGEEVAVQVEGARPTREEVLEGLRAALPVVEGIGLVSTSWAIRAAIGYLEGLPTPEALWWKLVAAELLHPCYDGKTMFEIPALDQAEYLAALEGF